MSPRPVQFSCVALDPSGEVVCAGSHDTYEVFVWSVQTGRLLEVRWDGEEGMRYHSPNTCTVAHWT